MIFNYQKTSTLDISFDDNTQKLLYGSDIVIEETLVRKLKDMRPLFKDATDYDDDLALYYMYNNIYRPEHKQLFADFGVKYEYTLLLPLVLNGECVKAHGHVHGISPVTKTNFLEIYEVLGGSGYFQLFKIADAVCEVVLVKVETGDFVVIPPGYYHLSINTGDIPFNFGDLIVLNPLSDYGLLKEFAGAPLFCMKDQNGVISFESNPNYRDKTLEVQTVTAATVPWDIPLTKEPLYAHFVADPHYFAILK